MTMKTIQLPPNDPFPLFQEWYDEAVRTEPNDPNAMSLATATAMGVPSVRIVLLKEFKDEKFIFYTNKDSQKGGEIFQNSSVALCFYWKMTHRQIRIQGTATEVSSDEADAYFKTRPTGSQIGAWASQQSRPMKNPDDLEKAIARYSLQFENGKIPRPPHWSGFVVFPHLIEFWEEKPYRLHRRWLYTRVGETWGSQILYP